MVDVHHVAGGVDQVVGGGQAVAYVPVGHRYSNG